MRNRAHTYWPSRAETGIQYSTISVAYAMRYWIVLFRAELNRTIFSFFCVFNSIELDIVVWVFWSISWTRYVFCEFRFFPFNFSTKKRRIEWVQLVRECEKWFDQLRTASRIAIFKQIVNRPFRAAEPLTEELLRPKLVIERVRLHSPESVSIRKVTGWRLRVCVCVCVSAFAFDPTNSKRRNSNHDTTLECQLRNP